MRFPNKRKRQAPRERRSVTGARARGPAAAPAREAEPHDPAPEARTRTRLPHAIARTRVADADGRTRPTRPGDAATDRLDRAGFSR
ncbi:hypothetical protein A6024_08535 [Rhodovulum sulfidophilum]|nr:hypothetical protein A6W98_08675 [Rhodovulum sulfidophilum DSM 1374]ANB37959.1 hypothetical protein A6024_08535 [Rhodovulum sulfidophilum]